MTEHLAHKAYFHGKTILITGGTGSWGTELVTQLLQDYNPEEIRIFSRGEHRQVEMKRQFRADKRIKFIIGDVRDKDRLMTSMRGVHYVFHLAALKHVPVCEENPWESVLTNVIGAQNVIDAAIANNVVKVIDVSTDKAVDPLNLYGTCKAVGEKLMIAANLVDAKTRFVCVRGGNVLGTRGSVVPLFREQILRAGEITVTDERMTRYMMNLDQAIKLLFEATVVSIGGEIFVMKMPALKVPDLAQVMIEHLEKYRNSSAILLDSDGKEATMKEEISVAKQPVKIRKIGMRPGEKLHEVLVSRYESANVIEHGGYFIILPNLPIAGLHERYHGMKRSPVQEFNSENAHQLSHDEITEMLSHEGWLTPQLSSEDWLEKLSREDLKRFFESEGWKRQNQ